MDMLKDRIDWVPVENTILAIDTEIPGVVLIAPNPSLPGIMVLADASTTEATQRLREKYSAVVEEVASVLGIATENPARNNSAVTM